ncbi:uncharacterized protein N7525_003659 [Penicillium rubens]|uniref:uncharacterized protein n=1 Tax=Penicillium rubens TaxID=1108849 RepID=UPI002A5AE553|nr:uncharacterized protein N7525_003659 [Penicillium rubens]KAJ5838471.1 hypothetical protein N7525_003659 [Penicillium rubens]KAJ5866522.1 hypothetical protein N7534_001075 [Penicillium rubens]
MRCRILLQPRPEFGGGKWQHSNCATRTQSEAHGRNIPQNMSTYIIDPNRVAYWNTEAETCRSWNGPSIDLLEEAIYVGSEPILSLLLDHRAVTNRRVFESMLRQVARKGHLGIAKLLVESGCGLESIELAEEYLALLAAVNAGHPDIVRFLLKNEMLLLHGANPSPEEPPGTNFVAPGLAVTLENYAVAQLLREFIDLAEIISYSFPMMQAANPPRNTKNPFHFSKAEDIRIYHDKINAQQVTDILV